MEIKIYCKYDELVNPNSLKNHPKNRNKHGQDQIERLAELYKYHGIRHPIIVSNLSKCIVTGHGRKLAALRAGLKEFPVVYQDFESSEAEYAFIQSDNAIALWAELDLAGINTDLPDLGPDFDIDMLGIKDFKLDLNEDNEGHTDPDEVPEDVPTKAKLGDLFILGNHRLLCGDSTDQATVERLMNGEKADMVFTSPPYNIGKNGFEEKGKYENDPDNKDDFCNFLNMFCEAWRPYSQYKFINLQFISRNKIEIIEWLYEQRGYFVDLISCSKDTSYPAMEANILNSDFELIFVFGQSNRTRHLKIGQYFRGTVSNLVEMKRNRKKEVDSHRAGFDISFPTHFIKKLTNENSLIADAFGGTGTTLIACEKTNRKCFMMELDPHYIDVIIQRWQNFTQKKAVRQDGVLWNDIQEQTKDV